MARTFGRDDCQPRVDLGGLRRRQEGVSVRRRGKPRTFSLFVTTKFRGGRTSGWTGVSYTLRYITWYMGKPLMIQEEDDRRIERLKRRLGIDTKVAVIRAGMALLERQAERDERVVRWKKAAATAAAESRRVNTEFRRHSRLKRL